MHEHTMIPCPHQQRLTEAPCTEIVRQEAGRVLDVAMHGDRAMYLSLSRLSHRLPRGQAHPEVVQGAAEFHYQITDALLPQTNAIFHDATALHTAVDVLNP
jgi:hypothetical protein